MSNVVILIIVLVVVVLVLAAAAAAITVAARKRRDHQQVEAREQAGALRREASERSTDVRQQELRAEQADAEAELARLRAEQAEQGAHAERLDAAHAQAEQEDVVRDADRLDPDVDHRGDDYRASHRTTSTESVEQERHDEGPSRP